MRCYSIKREHVYNPPMVMETFSMHRYLNGTLICTVFARGRVHKEHMIEIYYLRTLTLVS